MGLSNSRFTSERLGSDFTRRVVSPPSGLRPVAVRGVHGRAGLSAPAQDVQPAEDRGNLLLQHESHQAAVVPDLAGHRRPLQQGQSGSNLLRKLKGRARSDLIHQLIEETTKNKKQLNKHFFRLLMFAVFFFMQIIFKLLSQHFSQVEVWTLFGALRHLKGFGFQQFHYGFVAVYWQEVGVMIQITTQIRVKQ